MENQESYLFDLLESKSYDDLSENERKVVLTFLTEEEYRFQRRVLVATESLHYPVAEPLPLAVKSTKIGFFNRTIPLYQALLGAACLLLIFNIFQSKKESDVIPSVAVSKQSDTIEKFIYLTDTIWKEVMIPTTLVSIVKDTVKLIRNEYQNVTETKSLEARNTVPFPLLDDRLLQSNAVSFQEDESARILKNVAIVNEPIGKH